DLFALYPDEWLRVLMLWRTPPDATAYLRALLERRPEYWVKLAEVVTESRGDIVTMDISSIRAFLSLGDLAEASTGLATARYEGGARILVDAFVAELRLVLELLAELAEVRDCALELESIRAGYEAREKELGVSVWTHVRGRVEPIVGKEPWWAELVEI